MTTASIQVRAPKNGREGGSLTASATGQKHRGQKHDFAAHDFASCASSWLNLLGRIILAAVFGVAGMLKIVDPIGFARSIVDYDLVPELVVPVIAVVLPWWEVAAAALVIIGRWRAGALAVLLGMSAAFLTLGIITFARGLSPECGCFGFLSERVGPVSISIQAGLVTISVLLLRAKMRAMKQGQMYGDKEAQEPQKGTGKVAVASAAST